MRTPGATPRRGRVVGSVRGTPLVLTRGWFVAAAAGLALTVLALVRFTAAPAGPRHLVAAVVLWGSLQGGVLVHELGHGLAAHRTGAPPLTHTLTARGGVTGVDPRTLDARGALRVALAGPVTNLALAVVGVLGAAALVPLLPRLVPPGGARSALVVAPGSPYELVTWPVRLGALPLDAAGEALSLGWWVVTVWAAANVLLGLVNLVPLEPLDGAAALEACVWGRTGSRTRGRRVAAATGLLGCALAALALLVPPARGLLPLPLVLPGLLVLAGSAASSVEGLRGPGGGPPSRPDSAPRP